MWAEINADSLQPVPGVALGTGSHQKHISIYKISAYGRLCGYQHNIPAPVIAGTDIIDIKRMRKIGDDVFKRILCCFQFNYTKCHINQVFGIKQGLEVGSVFPWIHIMIYLSLFFHDLIITIRKETLDRDVEFVLFIRKFFHIRRQDRPGGRGSFYAKNIGKILKFTVKDQIIRFIATVCRDNVFFGMIRIKMIEYFMQGTAFIWLLTRLNNDIKESL